MPRRTEFTEAQAARLAGDESHSVLAKAFGVSQAPIRRWRAEQDWTPRATTVTETPAGDEPAGPSELDMAQDEVRRLRRALRNTEKAGIGDERALRAIESAVRQVEPVSLPARKVGPASRGSDAPHHRQILLLSDLHYGETVSGAQMNGINAYNTEIAEARMAAIVQAVLSFKRARPEMSGLDIWALGDMSSGAIHDLEETNAIPAAEQFVQGGYLLADVIRQLAPHYPDVSCAGIVGNHPRPKSQPASANSHNNGDWISYHIAKAATSEIANVSWEIPVGAQLIREVAGRKFLLWHGDGVRSSMPGVPWGGVARRWNELKSTYASQGIMLDYVAVGHFHQANVTGTGVFMNGSIVGPNAYGLKNFGGGQAATQLLITMDEKHRRVADVGYITL